VVERAKAKVSARFRSRASKSLQLRTNTDHFRTEVE